MLGLSFDNFSDLDQYVKAYAQNEHTVFVISDSRTVTTANKKVGDMHMKYPEKFKYAYVRYVCKHYGVIKSKSIGIRPNQRSYKIGCPAFIYASVVRKKDIFRITKCHLTHNHEIDKMMCDSSDSLKAMDEIELACFDDAANINEEIIETSNLTENEHHDSISTSKACAECGKLFRSASRLASHMSRHTGEKMFKCDICGSKFNLHSSLKLHIREHTGQMPYQCNTCEARFAHRSKFSAHIKIHAGENPYQCIRYTALRDEPQNSSVPRFSCDICDKSFTQKCSLKSHKQLKHDVIPRSMRSARFGSENTIPESEGEIFAAPVKFDNNESVQTIYINNDDRDAVHSPLITIECSDLSYDKIHKYYDDSEDSDVSKITCKLCGKMYNSVDNLKNHALLHVNQELYFKSNAEGMKDGKLKCNICGIKFGCLTHLESHQFWHSCLERIHNCQVCDASFYEECHLLCHEKTHAENFNNKQVDLCDVTFVSHERIYELMQNLKSRKRLRKKKYRLIRKSPFITPSVVALWRKRLSRKTVLVSKKKRNLFRKEIKKLQVPQKPLMYLCSICLSVFPSLELIQHHMTFHGNRMRKSVTSKRNFTKLP